MFTQLINNKKLVGAISLGNHLHASQVTYQESDILGQIVWVLRNGGNIRDYFLKKLESKEVHNSSCSTHAETQHFCWRKVASMAPAK